MDRKRWIATGFESMSGIGREPWLAYWSHEGLVVEDLSRGLRKTLLERGPTNCPPAWAPDGRTLYASRDRELVAIDVESGNARGTAEVSAIWLLDASPDGTWLGFMSASEVSKQMALQRVNLSTGGVETLFDNAWSAEFDWPRACAYAVRHSSASAEIWRLDLRRRSSERICDVRSVGHMSISPDGTRLAFDESLLGSCIFTLEVGTRSVCKLTAGFKPAWRPDAGALALTGGQMGDESVALFALDGQRELLLESPGIPTSRLRRGGWSVTPSWSKDGRFLAAGITHATFDHARYDTAIAAGKNREDMDIWCWRYEHKQAVFDFDVHQVSVREGYWSDVRWRP